MLLIVVIVERHLGVEMAGMEFGRYWVFYSLHSVDVVVGYVMGFLLLLNVVEVGPCWELYIVFVC